MLASLLRCFARCPACGQNSLLTTNLSELLHPDFDSKLVEKTSPKPMTGFTSIAKEGMMLHVWIKIPVADDYVPSQSRRNKRRAYPEKKDEIFVHYFLYIPRGILLLIQGNVAHSGSFLLQTKWSETRNQSLSIFIVAPMMPLKQMWIKEKTTTCLMTGTVMMKIFCMSCRTLSLTNTELLSSETE